MNTIITIGREFGSGGREIGKRLAELLGIAYYDKEKQPVTCNTPKVRTTQVIRPDGKTLLMIGNTGDKVKVKFDLSGLNYKSYKITDVFTGKPVESTELEMPRHGYALWKIEKN